MRAGSGYVRTLQNFGDCQLHVEWATPTPGRGEGQGRAIAACSSALDVMKSRSSIRMRNKTYADGPGAAVYGQYPPLVNASRRPANGRRMTSFTPRRGSMPLASCSRRCASRCSTMACWCKTTLSWSGPTSWLERAPYSPHPEKTPIALQDHGNPVRFRNIWVRELGRPGKKEFTLPESLLNSYTEIMTAARMTRSRSRRRTTNWWPKWAGCVL